jgi:7-carboxy-7-deazaguanine synthase
VVADEKDYIYAKTIIEKFKLFEKTNNIFFSPILTKIKPALLAEWMIKDKSKATLAIQLHKIIWGKNAKGK